MKLFCRISRELCASLLILIVSLTSIPASNASDNMENQGMDVMFVLDNSGSMIKNDPDFITKTAVIKFLEGLALQVRVGMVIFDTDARLIEPLTAISTAERAEGFLESLEMITYKGQFTNTPAGVERAVYELKTSGAPSAKKVIILLTDGIVDTGNRDQDLESEKWLKETLTRECEKLGIRIFGIAFTESADFRLMQTLAVNTEGEYFRAFTTDEVKAAFQKIDDIVSAAMEASSTTMAIAETTSMPAKQKAPPAAVTAKTDEQQKGKAELQRTPRLLAVVILAGLFLVYFMFVRKKKTIMIEPDPQESETADHKPKERPMDHKAELIDTENIISAESITLPLDRTSVSIGRDPSNDIVITKESISSLHATIDYKNGYYYIEDHRSTNGTRLNDKMLKENSPVRLKSGDKIHFAIYEFRFLMHDFAPYGETVMIKKDTKLTFES